MKFDKLVIDYSALARVVWNRVVKMHDAETNDDAMRRQYQPQSFALLLHETVFGMAEQLRTKDITLCLDSKPYWRTKYLELYYRNNHTLAINISDREIWLEIAGRYYKYLYSEKKNEYYLYTRNSGKPTKEEVNAMLVDREIRSAVWYVGNYYDEKFEKLFEILPAAKQLIRHNLQGYKGKRTKNRGRGAISDQQAMELAMEVARKSLTQIQGYCVKVVEIPTLEADDIAAVLSKKSTANSTAAIWTVDRDYQQLNTEHCQVYDNLIGWPQPDAGTRRDKIAKIVGGDTSDNLVGIRIKGAIGGKEVRKITPMPIYKPTPSNGTNKLLLQLEEEFDCNYDAIEKWLDENSIDNTYSANKMVVDLVNLPKDVEELATEGIQATEAEALTRVKPTELKSIRDSEDEQQEFYQNIKNNKFIDPYPNE